MSGPEKQAFDAFNTYRAGLGLPLLKYNAALDVVAQEHATEQKRTGNITDTPTGEGWRQMAWDNGYPQTDPTGAISVVVSIGGGPNIHGGAYYANLVEKSPLNDVKWIDDSNYKMTDLAVGSAGGYWAFAVGNAGA